MRFNSEGDLLTLIHLKKLFRQLPKNHQPKRYPNLDFHFRPWTSE
jgi:hypothetical protein